MADATLSLSCGDINGSQKKRRLRRDAVKSTFKKVLLFAECIANLGKPGSAD
jgi:hypothetical protein